MKTVNIAELKDRLSHFLRVVRRGESVLIRDRDQVVARIDPAGASVWEHQDQTERVLELESKGILRRGEQRMDPRLLSKRPKVKADVVAALLQERAEGT
jgi:antitoxin (DNA-binding transcriptional repressor) of toxin-antitoxin stability system